MSVIQYFQISIESIEVVTNAVPGKLCWPEVQTLQLSNMMKICAACNQTLSKEEFSKKQWNLKQQRRCKECIDNNREVNLEALDNDVPPSADGEGASDEDLFKQPAPRVECPICFLTANK